MCVCVGMCVCLCWYLLARADVRVYWCALVWECVGHLPAFAKFHPQALADRKC